MATHVIELNVGWGAGRFDADAHEVAAYLAECIRRYGLDLVGTSESQQAHIRALVHEAVGPAFGVAKRGEYLAIFRRSIFARRAEPRMWHLSSVARLVFWRQMRAGVFPLTIRQLGIPLRFMCSHAPAHVQAGRHWRDDTRFARLQVAASKRGHRRLGRKIRRAALRHPDLLQLLLMDENIDHFLREWREYGEAALHAQSVWPGHLPRQGSHDDRLIDVGYVRGGARVRVEVLEAHVSTVPRPPGYDHKLIWFRIRITVEAAA